MKCFCLFLSAVFVLARPLWGLTASTDEEVRQRFFELRCSSSSDSLSGLPHRLVEETRLLFGSSEGRRPLEIGLVLGLLAFQVDKDFRFEVAQIESLQRHRDRMFEVGRLGGGRLGTLSTAGALYGLGVLRGSSRLKSTGKQAAEALLLTDVLVAGMKRAVGRGRPDGTDNKSFPSGHSAGAFTLASVIHSNYGMAKALPAYAFAGFVAYSRINDDRHYLSDVLFGAAFGIAVGRTVSRFHREHMVIVPLAGRGRGGVAVSIDF